MSPLESVSLMISETVVAQFSLTVLSHQGLGALTNQHVTFGSCFVEDFQVATHSVFVDFFESTGAASTSESTRHLWKVFR